LVTASPHVSCRNSPLPGLRWVLTPLRFAVATFRRSVNLPVVDSQPLQHGSPFFSRSQTCALDRQQSGFFLPSFFSPSLTPNLYRLPVPLLMTQSEFNPPTMCPSPNLFLVRCFPFFPDTVAVCLSIRAHRFFPPPSCPPPPFFSAPDTNLLLFFVGKMFFGDCRPQPPAWLPWLQDGVRTPCVGFFPSSRPNFVHRLFFFGATQIFYFDSSFPSHPDCAACY